MFDIFVCLTINVEICVDVIVSANEVIYTGIYATDTILIMGVISAIIVW